MAGTWDCYCAICAGPMLVEVLRFLRRSREQSNRDADTTSGTRSDQDETMESDAESAGEEEPYESDGDEGYYYDPRIIQRRDTRWVGDCRQLCFNGYIGKSYLSGPGPYDNHGAMGCAAGDDPNREDGALSFCYTEDGTRPGEEYQHAGFPFHWKCYQLFCRYLTGSDDVELINKDVFYRTMEPEGMSNAYRLNLEYDEPGTGLKIPCEQTWESNRGQELYVSSPSTTPRLAARVRDDLSGRSFTMCAIDLSLGSKVRTDQLAQVPVHIMDEIISFLDAESLVSLLRASWCVHSARHDNNGFWKQHIKNNLGWFFELHQYIDSEASSSIVSMKAVYLWALTATKPRLNMRGTYMQIANRRRIWGVCRQLAKFYLAESQINYVDIEDAIINHAVCQYAPVVSHPCNLAEDLSSFYLIPSRQALSCPKTLETFWNPEGYLVGLAVTVKEGDQLCFGANESEYGIRSESIVLENDNWITGIVLHIPRPNILAIKHQEEQGQEADACVMSARGITFRTSAGTAVSHGETTLSEYCQRPLLAPEGQIVGVEGQLELIGDKCRLLRFGLLVLPNGDFDSESDDGSDGDEDMETSSKDDKAEGDANDDEETDNSHVLPIAPPPLLQKCLWSNEACDMNQHPIWESENLSMLAFGKDSAIESGDGYHPDLIPYEAFLWVHNSDKLMAVKKLIIYTAVDGATSDSTETSKRISNMRLEFDASSEMNPVVAQPVEVDGGSISDGSFEVFDIDGPGGERIIEASIKQGSRVEALKLRTNKEREFIWYSRIEVDDEWQTIQVSGGDIFAGLALSFGGICENKNDRGIIERHTALSRLAVLTMKNESSE